MAGSANAQIINAFVQGSTTGSFKTMSVDGAFSSTNNPTTMALTGSSELVMCFVRSTSSQPTSITDSKGLTWTMRASGNTAGGAYVSEWWAISPSSGSDTITANYSGGAFAHSIFFCIILATSSTPFDPNSSVPVLSNTTSTSGATPVSPISTNVSHDMILASYLTNASEGTVTYPAGFTQTTSAGTATDVSYQIVTTVQSGISPTYSWTGTAPAVGIFDAVQAAFGP